MRFRNNLLLPLGMVLLLLSACLHDSDLSQAPVVTYSNDIRRIMSGNCTFPACHGGGGGEAGGLTTYEELRGAVSPGKPRKSKLYRVITGRAAEKMPPSGYPDVTPADIRLIYLWIEQGAPNN